MNSWSKKYAFMICLFGIVIFLPFLHPGDYALHIGILIFINILLATSWAMILKMGYLYFAHATFMGIGAYGSALLMMKGGLSFWLSLPCGALIAAGVAMLMGFPFFRVKGIYFALITFAFSEVVRLIFIRWKTLTKGATGLHGVPLPDPIIFGGFLALHFDSKVAYYYLALILTGLCLFALYLIERSRFGFTIFAHASSESLLESVGVNTLLYRIQAFAISAFFAGFAGGIYVHFVRLAFPNTFSLSYSVDTVSHAIVGGTGNFWGPLCGAAFLTFCSEYFFSAAGFYSSILLGVFLMVTILVFPEGIIALPKRILAHIRSARIEVPQGKNP